MRTLCVTLPLPPSVNNQYVTVGRRRVLSRAAKVFRKDAGVIIDRLLADGAITEAWLDTLRGQPLACDLVFFFETPFKRDLDGGLKISLDALCERLGLDDRYVVSLTLAKQLDPLRPRVEIELGPASDWQMDQTYVLLDKEDT
ncbi:MAG: RusA family crossover junction endodeoxyribonuclease [Thermomicrobiales bacterium]|nr:RusA family crossover junction endodeoxyribonuclease [Thermomicrobiales bacterium]